MKKSPDDLTPTECRRLADLLSLPPSLEFAGNHYMITPMEKLIAWLRAHQDRPA